jgi:[protein-PII] uridylyltransferase
MLIERRDLLGDAFCRAYSDAADEWLTGLFNQATGGEGRGMALVAVGGYGRAELCPFSDLDVLLIHRGRRDISATADKIWYPVWDEGISLDHSVRRPSEALELAGGDLRVALTTAGSSRSHRGSGCWLIWSPTGIAPSATSASSSNRI